jgi:hypothetical protein
MIAQGPSAKRAAKRVSAKTAINNPISPITTLNNETMKFTNVLPDEKVNMLASSLGIVEGAEVANNYTTE